MAPNRVMKPDVFLVQTDDRYPAAVYPGQDDALSRALRALWTAWGLDGDNPFQPWVSPGGRVMVEQHLAAAMDGQVVAVQEQFADGLAQRRAAGVAARDHVVATVAQPLAEEPDLRRLARAVAAIDGKENAALHKPTFCCGNSVAV